MSLRVLRTQKTVGSGIASATTAAAANPARISYIIFNLGTNTLYVKEGAGATTTDFSYPLTGGTANDDGNGMAYESPAEQVYTGIITIAGTSPRYVLIQREQNA